MTDKPTLDEMIDAAALLPPGPDAWNPIFEAYPEITPLELAERFRKRGERYMAEADELRTWDPRVHVEDLIRQAQGDPALAKELTAAWVRDTMDLVEGGYRQAIVNDALREHKLLRD